MSKTIKAIDKEAVHRICSGQVVLNLATAVKELVENSLDAGATTVEIRLREHGSELIEVSDNGTGVLPSNFEGLTAKHHTSKLQDFSDLVNVETFGFRGEALSSLCALSNVTIVSKHESEAIGSKLVFDHHGNISSTTSIARQVGTTVTIENLFKSLPVRQKEFHRNIKREYAKMIQILNAYGLVSTNVRIMCVNQTKKGGRSTIMSTHGCKTVRENIACIFGTKQLNSLLDLKKTLPNNEILTELKVKEDEADKFELEGLISSCAHGQGRSSGDRQFFYINNRPCEPSKIVKCVNEVYHHFNLHQTPFVFLNVTVARDSVDVNVTPDKRQIFLDHEKLLIATIKASLMNLYEKIPSTFQVSNIFSTQTSFTSSIDNHVSNDEEIETKTVSTSSVMSKWRHAGDKSTSEFNSSKRKNENKCNSSSKQMKLDSTITVTPVISINPVKVSYLENIKVSEKTPEEHESKLSQDSSYVSAPEDMSDQAGSQNNFSSDIESQNQLESSFSIEIFSSDSLKTSEINSGLPQSSSVSNFEDKPKSLKIEEMDNVETMIIDSNVEDSEMSVSKILLSKEEVGELEIVMETKTPELRIESVIVVDNSTPSDTNLKKTVIVNNISIESLRRDVEKFKMDEQNGSDCIQNKFHATIDPSKNEQAENELNREISKDMFAKMEIIGQFNLGFIIVQLGTDLFIVDQHATDEKYNFETLQLKTTLSNQKLVVPQLLELTAANESILIDNIEVFKKNGFEFSIDENADPMKRVKLTAIPMSENWHFGKDDIDELLFMLQNPKSPLLIITLPGYLISYTGCLAQSNIPDSPGTMCRPSRVRSMFASRACRMSVMIGTALSVAVMKRLVTHMGEIEQPWNCPHGRPTMRHLINLSLLS